MKTYNKCINCGSTDIVFHDYGYNTFNISEVYCATCKRNINMHGISDEKKVIKIWNKHNDPKTEIELQEQLKDNAISEIKRLKELFNIK